MAKSKNTRRLIKTSNSFLTFIVGAVGMYATFYFSNLPEQVIQNLHTTSTLEDDQDLIDDLETKGSNLEKINNQKDDLQNQWNRTSNKLEEGKAKKDQLKSDLEKEQKKKDVSKSLDSRINNKINSVKQQAKNAENKKAEVSAPILEQLKTKVTQINNIIKEVSQKVGVEQDLYKNLETKWTSFQKGLNQQSNFKEFLLYIFGLKLLWGIFTGYSRTFYPYKERYAFVEALKAVSKELPGVQNDIATAKASFDQEVQTLRSTLKRAEDSLSYNPKAQSAFVSTVQTPLLNAIGNFQFAFEELHRSQEVASERINSFIDNYYYLPLVAIDYKPYNQYQTWELAKRQKEEQKVNVARESFTQKDNSLQKILNELVTLIPKFKESLFVK